MAAIIRMPELVAGAGEAAIAGWLVSEGDEIVSGQVVAEIETEKATVEFEVESSGTLVGILLEPGSAVQVGTPIAVLGAPGQSREEALADAGVTASGRSFEPRDEAADSSGHLDASTARLAPEIAVHDDAADPRERLFASPLVRKVAREQKLDLSSVRGSGPNGRIVRRDLEGLIGSAQASRRTDSNSIDPTPSSPLHSGASKNGADNKLTNFSDVPHTGMRRAIARRLTESKSSVPHFYLAADCHVDALLTLRKQINEQGETRISVNDMVVKAVACALRDVPEANAIWTDEATRRFERADISVAVSVPGGLLTPVVNGVDLLPLSELSAQIRDFAERARENKLKQHELEGGSFSVSNLGMYGTQEFSAILNPPQSGILAVGAATKRVVVEDDGTVGVATLMTVTLSADHRVLDGAIAAEWLAAFQKRIEHPLGMLI